MIETHYLRKQVLLYEHVYEYIAEVQKNTYQIVLPLE